jgi:hypothetical protein
MPIFTLPLLTETSLNIGLELGKLAPTPTDSGLPFTEILTAPLCASVRAVSIGFLSRDAAVVDVVAVEELVSVDPVPVWAVSCWTKGSLLANVEKLASWPFERRGGMSELVSFGLGVDAGVALAGVPVAVVPGVVVPGVVESTDAAAVVVAAGVADFFPPRK